MMNETQFYQDIGLRIKFLRESKRDISQDLMAERLNKKRTTYQAYEYGHNRIPLYDLTVISQVLDIDIGYLVFGDNAQNNNRLRKSSFQIAYVANELPYDVATKHYHVLTATRDALEAADNNAFIEQVS